MQHWPQRLFLYESNYPSDEEYQQELKEARSHYDFSEEVEGGYVFFEYRNDYDTWKAQK